MGKQYTNYKHEAPRVRMADVVVSEHALHRAVERGLGADEIRKAIEAPRHAYISREHGAWIFERGKVLVGLREHWTEQGKWAVTTLINTRERRP